MFFNLFYMILVTFFISFNGISTMSKLDKFQSNLPDQGCVSIAPTSSIRIYQNLASNFFQIFSKIQKIRNPKNNRNRQPKLDQTSLLETLHRSR